MPALSFALSLSLSLLPVLRAATPAPQGHIIDTLVSSYTPGEQLAMEVTPDGKRGFQALGATIAVLDLTGTTPVQFDKHQVPDCQPLAMRYYHQVASVGNPAADYLFIAGGALGVRRLTLCPGIFSTPPQICSQSTYADLSVEAAIENGYFERKRCVDVDVLATATGPVLFALFAASSDPSESVSPTELRAYIWNGVSATRIASYTFGNTVTPAPVAIGTSLAVDPADNNSIYVGMGKGGIWRADLSGGTLTATQIWSTTSCGGGSHPNQPVRDLAIVRVTTTPAQSILYAALNYEELLEITGLGTVTASCSRSLLHTPGYPERITAVVNQGNDVWLAVVAQTGPGKVEDSLAPRNVNGVWTGPCLGLGITDPNDPGIAATHSSVQMYQHKISGGASLLTYRASIDYPVQVGELGSNSASILTVAGATKDRLFMSSRVAGMEVYDVARPSGQATLVGPAFKGDAFNGQDSVVSSLNSGVVQFIYEITGAVATPKQMVYIDNAPPFGITPVPQTENSPCPSASNSPVNCYPAPNTVRGPIDPGLYVASILDEAHWPDPAVPNREYFLPGRKIWERYDPNTCAILPDCGLPWNPCDPFGVPTWNLQKPDGSTGHQNRTGWRLISLLIPGTGMPPSGPSLQAKTWQFDNPIAHFIAGVQPEELVAPTDDRVQSIVDTRQVGGLPTVAYLSRSGTSYGVKVLKTDQIVNTASTYCSQLGLVGGTGELLPPVSLDFRTTLTHLEFELDGTTGLSGCVPITPCPVGSPAGYYASGAHQIINERTTLYTTQDLNGAPMTVLAIASGFPASYNGNGYPQYQTGQLSTCHWVQYAGRPMLVLLDVTRTGDGVNFANPRVLRVGLGNGQGHAFCVRTKTSGLKTYAYVGDITGKIQVYDVSGNRLLPFPTLPYASVPSQFLSPLVELPLPRDPVDGQFANCIDMELIGNFLYCALGRIGVGIIDVSVPTAPNLIEVVDTPGLALGLSSRGASGVRQLVVGDSRCGIRVYQ